MHRQVSVSIIIPTYNSANYIAETVKSALNQQDIVVEVLVVDDGSEDNTIEVLKKSGLMTQIIYLSQSNQGVSAARNTGLSKAIGEYICFLDSDDVLEPTHCSELFKLMQNNSFRIAYSNYEYFLDDNSKSLISHHYPTYSGNVVGKLIRGNFIPVGTVLIERNILEGITFDTELTGGEDWHFWIRLAMRHSIHYYPKVLAKIRVRKGSASTELDMMRDHYKRAFEKTEIMIRTSDLLENNDKAVFYYGWAMQCLTAKEFKSGLVKCYKANKYNIDIFYNAKFFTKLMTIPLGLFPLARRLYKKGYRLHSYLYQITKCI